MLSSGDDGMVMMVVSDVKVSGGVKNHVVAESLIREPRAHSRSLSTQFEGGTDSNSEMLLFEGKTKRMLPPIVIAMMNIIAMAVAFSRTIYSAQPQWSKFIGGGFFSFWVLPHLNRWTRCWRRFTVD
ncbi:hypothetical protein RJT34_13412 [Clitoria ternatea]|uniref:Uncharacterized protein n=1 Tax=Clitoria ternatea TaxID=43366 RepID=A0AAN9JR06_CLITE